MERIVVAKKEDLDQMYEIYQYYVENTAVTFDCNLPSKAVFSRRMDDWKGNYPVFKAEENGRVIGYAYAGPFIEREAYARCCELTIYLHPDFRRKGIGKKLYTALERELEEKGYRNLYACIGVPIGEDPYLNLDSPHFHEKMGFQTVGTFHRCGFKFGRWYDMIWMEKRIGIPAETER